MARQADAALFVSDLTQELTAPEIQFLRSLAEQRVNTICVFTKADLTMSGTAIVERNRLHLAAAGLGHLPHAVVSSALHAFALEHNDAELEEESGFGQLFDLLKRRGFEPAQSRVAMSARAELEFVSAQLELEAHATERAADGHAQEVSQELGEAKQRVVLARSDQASWRKELATGIRNLQSDAQLDRQQRRLAINRWIENVLAEEAEGSEDQTLESNEFIELLYRQVLDASVAHFDKVQAAIDGVTATVRKLYEAESADGLMVHVENEFRPTLDHVPGSRPTPTTSRTRSLLAVAQSSSSGLVLGRTALGVVGTFGFTAGGVGGGAAIVGISVAAMTPLLLGAPVAVLLAMRSVRDDRKRQRDLRVHELRKQANTYLQEAWLEFDHESRRSIDEAQTMLREAIELRSRQVEQTLVHAAEAAERIGRAREAGTIGPELGSEIARGRGALEAMRAQAQAVVAGGGR
jgi:hypothetical protein